MNSPRQSDDELREQDEASLPVEDSNHPSPQTSRRSFTKYLTLAGLVALAAVLWALFRGRFSKTSFPQIVIAQAGEIPVGGSKIFQYPRPVDPCILIRTDADSYVAYSRFCTHQECVVFYRPARNGFECPCHGGFYSLADGSVQAGPPPRPLPRILLERRGENLVATGVATA
jgi:nitrite reductase/ring-hydroxylating ferredoxin subunit